MNGKTYLCDLCNAQFTTRGNLGRHSKIHCPVIKIIEKKDSENSEKLLYFEKQLNELKNIIQEKDTKIEQLHIELEKKTHDVIDSLKNSNDFLKETHKTASEITTKSMDALAFLMKHRKNAPALKKLTQDDAIKMLTCEKDLYKNLIYHADANSLHKYIGKIYTKEIIKEDPNLQSVWSTDASRSSFIVKVGDNPTWMRDPKGNILNEYICEKLRSGIKLFIERCLYSNDHTTVKVEDITNELEYDDLDIDSLDINQMRKRMSRDKDIHKVLAMLRTGAFENKVIAYVASLLILHKTNIDLLEDDNANPKAEMVNKSNKKVK